MRRQTNGKSGGTEDDADQFAREQMKKKLRALREDKNNAMQGICSLPAESESQYCGFIPSESLSPELATLSVLAHTSPGQLAPGYKEGGFGGIGVAKTMEKIQKPKVLLFTQMLVNEVTFEAGIQYRHNRIFKHEIR